VSADAQALRADARRNRERLIVVAREAFNEHGMGTPLDDIARRAQVGPGTLYRHFPTREDLMVAVYRSDVDLIAARADTLAAELPPLEALTTWLREQLDYISHRHGLGAAVKTMLGTESETMEYCKMTMRAAGLRLLRPAQEAGLIRADVDAPTVLRLVHAVGIATETAPEQSPVMLDVVLAGLRTDTE
jgi:AcrR family transcriptional regulator